MVLITLKRIKLTVISIKGTSSRRKTGVLRLMVLNIIYWIYLLNTPGFLNHLECVPFVPVTTTPLPTLDRAVYGSGYEVKRTQRRESSIWGSVAHISHLPNDGSR